MPGYEVIGKEELLEIKEIFDKSKVLFRHSFDHLRNGIYKVRDFEVEFAKYMCVKDTLAVSSGTAALKIALKALGIEKGKEVITQAFTFVATVESIIEAGLVPVITEVDDTLNMDPIDLEKKITKETRAIIVVHMLGVPSQMNEIKKIADKYNLYIIEDTAWGCGGKYCGQYLGTIGDVGAFSFDFNKALTTGEGGMLICKNDEILAKAKAYHDHGHENNPNLPRWEDSRSGSGFNFRMCELQGAVGLAQLKKLNFVLEQHRKNKQKIKNSIGSLTGLTFRNKPVNVEETADALIVYVNSHDIALKCRQELLKFGISTKMLPEAINWHFAGLWNHIPELVKKYKNLQEAFPKSNEILNRSVAIPILINMPSDFPEKIYSALVHATK